MAVWGGKEGDNCVGREEGRWCPGSRCVHPLAGDGGVISSNKAVSLEADNGTRPSKLTKLWVGERGGGWRWVGAKEVALGVAIGGVLRRLPWV